MSDCVWIFSANVESIACSYSVTPQKFEIFLVKRAELLEAVEILTKQKFVDYRTQMSVCERFCIVAMETFCVSLSFVFFIAGKEDGYML